MRQDPEVRCGGADRTRRARPARGLLWALLGCAFGIPGPSMAAGPIEIRGTADLGSLADLSEVRVELLLVESSWQRLSRLHEGREEKPIACTVPGPDGDFELSAPQEGFYRVRLRGPGLVPVTHDLSPLTAPVTLAATPLHPAVRWRTRFVDADGEPVAGVGIEIWASPPNWEHVAGSKWTPEGSLLRSDGAGRVSAWLPTPAGRFRLSGPGVEPVLELFEARRLPQRWVLERRAERIGFRVERASGEAAAGVFALDGAGLPLGRSDEDGRIDLVAVPKQGLWLLAADGGSARWSVDSEAEAPTIVLHDPIDHDGTVVSTAGDPLADARVRSWAQLGRLIEISSLARTDRRGSFRVSLPDVERHFVVAGASGFLSALDFHSVSRADPGSGLTLVLAPALTVVGTVVDSVGRGVPSASIEAELTEKGPLDSDLDLPLRVAADENGRFVLVGVAGDSLYRVEASAPGFAARTIDFVSAASSDLAEPLEIVLERGLSISGVVLSPEGVAPGSRVRLLPSGPHKLGTPVARWERLVEVDDAGQFLFADLPTSRFDLTADAPGYAVEARAGIELTDVSVDVGVLELEPGVELRGRVMDDLGVPVEGVEVYASVALEQIRTDWTLSSSTPTFGGMARRAVATGYKSDARGRFVVSDLKAGRELSLVLQSPSHERTEVPGIVPPLSEPLVVRLQRTASVSGTTLDAHDDPVRAEVELRWQTGTGGGSNGTQSDEDDGRFDLHRVSPGRYTLSATGVDGGSAEQSLLLGPGDVREVTLVLGPSSGDERATIVGRVIRSGGEGVRTLVHVSPSSSERESWFGDAALSQMSGEFRLEGVPVGRVKVRAQPDQSFVEVEKEIDLGPGETRVDLVFDGFLLGGRLIDETGEPVAAADIFLESGDAMTSSTMAGRFRFFEVPRGRHRIRVQHPEWVEAEQVVVDVAEDRLDLEIVLVRGSTVFGRILGVGADELSALRISVRSGTIGKVVGVKPDGTYEARGLAPGDWTIFAFHPTTSRRVSATLTIRDTHDVVEQDLEFEAGWAVRGRLSEDGRPHVGVEVDLLSLDGRVSQRAISDYRGAFVVEGLASGSYRLLGQGEEIQLLRVDSDVDLGDLEVDFADSQP